MYLVFIGGLNYLFLIDGIYDLDDIRLIYICFSYWIREYCYLVLRYMKWMRWWEKKLKFLKFYVVFDLILLIIVLFFCVLDILFDCIVIFFIVVLLLFLFILVFFLVIKFLGDGGFNVGLFI